MASFQNNYLGIVRGKMGDIVFKTRKGKPYIASRPASYKKSMSKSAVTIRSKFKFCNALFSAIGKIYFLKQTWKEAEIEGDNFINKLFKFNYEKVTQELDFSNISLAPTEGKFNLSLNNVQFDGKEITITTEATGIQFLPKCKCSVQGIMCFTERIKENSDPYYFIPVFTEDQPYDKTKQYEFKYELSLLEKQIAEAYNKRFLLINFAIKETQGEPYAFSKELSEILLY